MLAAIFKLHSVVQLLGYSLQGLYTANALALGLAASVPTVIELAAGVHLRGRPDVVWFRRLIIVMLVLSIANLLRRTFVA